MRLFKNAFLLMTVGMYTLSACQKDYAELSLAGEWQVALDPEDKGMDQQWQNKNQIGRAHV